MNRSSQRTLAVAAASLSVLLGACGVSAGTAHDAGRAVEQVSTGTGRSVAASTLTAAGRTTAQVTTERIAITGTTTGLGGADLTVTAEGAFDAKARRGHVSTSLDGLSGPADGFGDSEVVYDGDTVYLRSHLLEMFGDGKPWLKITSDQLGEVAGKLDGSVQGDPGAMLDLLEGAGTVEEVGSEAVRGVDTTHYRATVDLTKALDQLDSSRRQKLRDALAKMGAAQTLEAVPVEVWIDGDGYVRRLTTTLDVGALAKGEAGRGAAVTQTAEFYAFDEPVEITVPKASEVSELDLSKLFHN